MSEYLDILFISATLGILLSGYPVALTLAGMSVLFAILGWQFGQFDLALFQAIPSRLFGIATNQVLLAIPLFVFMGLVLERSKLADDMLRVAAQIFSGMRGGLTVSVSLVGLLLAASTGIVGASVATLGLLALPSLLRNGVSPSLAGGTVAAAGTLGQIIPPSIVLIVLGDQMSNAWQEAQTRSGNFAPDSVSVADLFAGAIVPGILLVSFFAVYQIFASKPTSKAQVNPDEHLNTRQLLSSFVPPLVLIIAVLGSILAGLATPSEAAGVGAVGALFLARNRLDLTQLKSVLENSVHLISMIFLIIIGASLFSLVFRGLGGDETIARLLADLPGGIYGALFIVMLAIFLLGFILDFLEITFIVVPLVAPVLLTMSFPDGSAMSPVWLGVLIALNLQTSFLTPPFGLSLFYLRSVAADKISTADLYSGVVPFVLLQLLTLLCVIVFPQLATIVPDWLYGG